MILWLTILLSNIILLFLSELKELPTINYKKKSMLTFIRYFGLYFIGFYYLGIFSGIRTDYSYEYHGTDWTGTCRIGQKQSPIDLVKKDVSLINLQFNGAISFILFHRPPRNVFPA